MIDEKTEKLLMSRLDIQQRLIEQQRRVIEEFKVLVSLLEERDRVVRG